MNIPGDMRKKIISRFERPSIRVSIFGPLNSKSKLIQMGSLGMERSISTPIPAEYIERQNRTKVSSSVTRVEPSISNLYPVWKTLLKLMMNDSLIRFKALGKWRPEGIVESTSKKPSLLNLLFSDV